MTAQDMPSIHPDAEYLVPESDECDAPWKTVRQQATSETRSSPEAGGPVQPLVTVDFDDGSHRTFDPEDTVDVGWSAP